MKFNRYIVIGIGVGLCIGLFVGFQMSPIKKAKADIQAKEADLQKAQDTYARLSQVQADLDAKTRELQDQQHRLNMYMKTRMPDISFTDRIQGMISYWRECSDVMGPTLEHFILSRPGVTGVSGLQIKGPSTNPNAITGDRIDIPLGTVQVRVNSYRNALNFFREMKHCPRLVYLTSVKLDGPPSPDLMLTLGMTAYIFPSGSATAAIAEAGQGGDNAAAGGAAAPMMPAAAPPAGAAPPGVAAGPM